MKQFFADRRPHNGLSYDAYRQLLEEEADRVAGNPVPDGQDPHAEYYGTNLARTRRIEKTCRPSDEIRAAAAGVTRPQLWMVLSETWCADSAQNLPYIAAFARLSSAIELRILPRDANLDVMDEYLTNGSWSIPKLVSFDTQGNELFQWGPRPREAAELFRTAKEAGVPKPEILERIHLWYGKNRGKAIEAEFTELLRGHGAS